MKKCKTVHYGKNNQFYQYTMNFEDIETAREEKDLGVTFQQVFKFSSHTAEKVNKANSILSLIVRTFDYTGPFPAILGKGPWLELGKNMGHLGYFANFLDV